MSTKTKSQAAQLHGQVSNISVACQLTLDSFLLLYRESRSIEKLLAKLSKEDVAPAKPGKRQSYLIKELASLLQDDLTGHLNRLQKDSLTLSRAVPGEETATMYELACKGWLEAQQALQAHLHAQHVQATPGQWDPFLTQTQKLLRTIERLTKCWPKLFDSIPADENILFFLITRREQIDALYNAGFTCALLKKFSPAGRDALRRSIVEAYLTRGFDDVIPSIDASIEDLSVW
jgi:hypothetical protein